MIPEKVYYKSSNAENYIEIVNELYLKIQDTTSIEKHSAPFVLFTGTCLEYLLNDLLIEHSLRFFHNKNQRKYTESFISMNFNAKLTCILPIISNHRFSINIDSAEYKNLCDMITQRNRIAHGKDFYLGADTVDIKEDSSFSIKIDLERINNNPLKISLKQCQDYKKAIDTFYNEIFKPYENDSFSKSPFVIEIVKKLNKKEKINLK
jgi:hypothetical protein